MQVEVLSGGEKARLALAKFMLSQVRLLRHSPSTHASVLLLACLWRLQPSSMYGCSCESRMLTTVAPSAGLFALLPSI